MSDLSQTMPLPDIGIPPGAWVQKSHDKGEGLLVTEADAKITRQGVMIAARINENRREGPLGLKETAYETNGMVFTHTATHLNVEITTLHNKATGNSYEWKMEDGKHSFFVRGKDGKETPISPDAFKENIGFVAELDGGYVARLRQSIFALQSPPVAAAGTVSYAQTDVVTNGTCAIIGDAMDPMKRSTLYQHQQPVGTATFPTRFKPDAYYKTSTQDPRVAANLQRDPSLQHALPKAEIDKLASLAQSGQEVRIAHVDAVLGCTLLPPTPKGKRTGYSPGQ